MRSLRVWLLWIVAGLLSGVSVAAQTPGPAVEAVVPHFHLTGMLSESPVADPFGFTAGEVTSLGDLVRRMGDAGGDDRVRAVVLTFDNMALGLGQLEEIRTTIRGLRTAGKKVYVHTGSMSTFVYGLLCAGDRLSVEPQSMLWLTGIYGESLYVKDLLDKIGVRADFMHMGDYKSAAEMLTRTEPSGPAEQNVNWLLDGYYDSLVRMIAGARNMTAQQVRDLIDRGPYMAEQALAEGLIDAVQTRDAFLAQVRKDIDTPVRFDNRYGRKEKPAVNLTSPLGFFSLLGEMMNPPRKPRKNAVAIVYVEGAIVPGYGQPSPFGPVGGAYSGDIRKALETAAADDTVKAVVLRVDSPGGSAEASEMILNATRQVRARKPFVVSMGDTAASGGYYVSCAAETIFANEVTITASIGVVGGKLVTADLWDKLGVNWVGYRRGANADLFNSDRPFDDPQRQVLERYMQTVYDVFKGHVAQARDGKLTGPLDEIAGGRVYTGRQALDLGLVDRIGGLEQAVQYVAAKASLDDYEVRVIPEPQDFITMLMDQYSGKGERPSDISIGGAASILADHPAMAGLLDLLRKTEPQRARALLAALQRIELIRTEGVVMMMPFDVLFR
ncbi:signal peptide peptidase SppA [Anaerobaca lacustris]|uniref:Signal peptide peptidase SppA n=1 Tax=Anaerobaca lacustris TaxID=3044600 RepID=A0AAW6U0A5_9BACT|nr:signal peptide peptidase SppA [Sedimentisphaerales bacterium M17dextr]